MAEKIIGIKIVADTNAAGESIKKLGVEFSKLETSQESLSGIEEKRNFLMAEQVKAASRLIAQQDKLNASNLSANFAINALQASFTKYKKEIQETEAALKSLNYAQNLGINPNAKTASGSPGARLTTPVKQQAGFSYVSGAGGVSQAKAVLEQETLAKSISSTTKAQKELNKALAEGAVQHKNMFVHIGEIIGIYRLYNAALNLTQQALLGIPKAGLQQEANQAGLLGIFGSEEARKNLQFVRDVATEAGQSVTILERAYSRYASSAILAGATQKEVNKSFKDFAELGTILKLPEEKLDSLFLALDQMYAKGVVQSEEIKKQLGNVLPGAVEIGAQAIGKTPAAFMEAMKKNLVIAKDFVPLFAAKYREIFGGPDDAVFRLVSDKLQSNLERVQNEFTFIARDIYASTKEYMNSTVKLFAEGLASIRENLTGIGQVLQIFSVLLTARLGVSLVEATLKIDLLLKKIPMLVTVLTGLPAPIAAGAAALAAMYVSLNDLNLGYTKAEGFTVTYKEQTVSLVSYIQATALQVLDDFRGAYESIRESIEALTNIDMTAVFSGLIPETDTIIKFASHLKSLKDSFSLNPYSPTYEEAFTKNYENLLQHQEGLNKKAADKQRGIIAKAAELDKEAYIKSFNGKGADAVSAAIASGKLKDAKEITDALAQADLTIKAPKLTPIEGDVSTKNAKGRSQAHKDLYKALEDTQKTYIEKTKTQFAELDSVYSNQFIPLAEYYNRKKVLIDEDYKNQVEQLQKIKALADKSGDTAKIANVDEKLSRLEETKAQALIELENKRYSEAFAHNTELRNYTMEYYNSIGEADKALELQLQDRYTLIKNALREQIEAGNTLKQVDLDRINAIEAIARAESSSAIAKASVQGKLNLNAADQERINVLRNIGAISELTAATQLQEVYKEQIALKEELIRVEEDKLTAIEASGQKESSAYVKLKGEIDEARASLDNFRLSSNTVGQYFQTQLTPAFTNAFTGFITGSMTAKEAFRSFATDILKRIADIAAQQLATQIIGGLVGGAGKYFGGGSVDAFGANATGRIVAQAAGGVNTGMGGGNGYVLTSPTLYPGAKPIAFASGGVLAGEAGTEAVLPLKRTSSGKLGVETTGASQGGDTYYINVSVEKNQNETPEDTGNRLAIAMMKKIAQSEIANANRPGNQSNKITTFG